MHFELLTFSCREIIKLSRRIWHGSKINVFISRKRIKHCIVCIEKAKLQMRFLDYALFLAKSHVSVPFSWPFFWQNLMKFGVDHY